MTLYSYVYKYDISDLNYNNNYYCGISDNIKYVYSHIYTIY